MTEIFEFGYKKYKKLGTRTIMLTPTITNLAEFNIFELQKNNPEAIQKSVEQIEQLRADIKKGDKFPPIIIEVNEAEKFVTLTDGNHRVIAYRDEEIKITQAEYVVRVD